MRGHIDKDRGVGSKAKNVAVLRVDADELALLIEGIDDLADKRGPGPADHLAVGLHRINLDLSQMP